MRWKLKVHSRGDEWVLNEDISNKVAEIENEITWKKRMMFQMRPRMMEEFPSATSAASILTSFTWGHTHSICVNSLAIH